MSHAGLAAHVNQAGRARGLAPALRTHRRGPLAEGPAPPRPGARPDLRGARRPAAPARHARRHRPRRARRSPSARARHPAVRVRRAGHRPVALRRAAAPAHPGRPRGHRHARRHARSGSGRTRPRTPTSPAAGRHRVSTATSRCCARPARTTSRCTARPAASRPGPGSSASSTPRPRPLLRGSYTDETGPPTAPRHRRTGGRRRASAPTTPTRTASPSATSTRRCAWPRPAGTGGSARYVIALLVNQSLFMREYRQAVAFAEAALRAAGRHITPALAADLYAMQAKAYAHLGDGTSALACIRRAESGRRSHPPRTRAGRDRLRPAGPRQRPGGGGAAQPRRSGGGPRARGGRRRHPGARPGPGAPAGHAQHDRTAPGRGRQGGGHRGARWRNGPGGWSRSGCATGSARYANTSCAAAARARRRPPQLIDGALRVPL